jgi:hypothetical protein
MILSKEEYSTAKKTAQGVVPAVNEAENKDV